MPQIINESNLLSNLGQSLGQGIGGGLSQLLASHVANKARKYEEGNLAKKLEPLLGVNAEQAQAIASLGSHNPKAQQAVITNLLNMRSRQEANKNFGQNIKPVFGQPSSPLDLLSKSQAAQEPVEQSMPQQQPSLQTALQSLTGQNPSFTEQQMLQSLVPQQVQNQQKKQQPVSPVLNDNSRANMNRQQLEDDLIDEKIRNGEFTEQQVLKIEENRQKRRANDFKERKYAQERADKVIDPIVKEADYARADNLRFKKMLDLDNDDKILPGTYLKALAKFGIDDVGALLNPETEEAIKIQNDFTRHVKERFGGKITNDQIKIFLRSLPNALQSKEGRARVIHSLMTLNKIPELKLEEIENIIQENNGELPLDLNLQLSKRMRPIIDGLSDEFINNIKIGAGSQVNNLKGIVGTTVFDTKTGNYIRIDENGNKTILKDFKEK